eukprot:TRINITY_DN41167_c0_g1_i1.p1 TRINITY_DN41167_c0_g1~~TRINITY_DN41167_c0_g1_i1.p1  ORF type:complete len:256 (-),score=21.03 TRINITY_DN41167_c0_g1_i1:10-777(-)
MEDDAKEYRPCSRKRYRPQCTFADAGAPCVVIWLHGMGGSGAVEEEWKRRFDRIPAREKLASCRWLFPRAPSGPVRFHGGRVLPRWWDTWGDSTSATWADSPEDVVASIEIVHSIIDGLDVEANRIIVGGFSQGAALALIAALKYKERLAGCVMIGGWLTYPIADNISRYVADRDGANTPVWWAHGRQDRSIPISVQESHCATLDAVRAQLVDQRQYSCGHWPNAELLSEMLSWMRTTLSERDGYNLACVVSSNT